MFYHRQTGYYSEGVIRVIGSCNISRSVSNSVPEREAPAKGIQVAPVKVPISQGMENVQNFRVEAAHIEYGSRQRDPRTLDRG